MSAIVGKKLGMTRVFLEDGTAVPVTVIEAAPNKVTAIRRTGRDGYDAIQLAADPVNPEDKLTKAELGHLRKAGAPAMRSLVEFRDAEVTTTTAAGSGGAQARKKVEEPEGEVDSADSQTLLIKVDPELLDLPDGRDEWAPEGCVGYSKICTHAGCPVGLYRAESHQLLCPCHQSTFDVLVEIQDRVALTEEPLEVQIADVPRVVVARDDHDVLALYAVDKPGGLLELLPVAGVGKVT